MADAELEQIRKARLAQLQAAGGGGARGGGPGGGVGGEDQAGSEEQQRQQQEDARRSMLNQILQPDAADRLGRIRLVKESRAEDVENRLIMLARTGQLREKVTEEQLKQLLNAMAAQQEETKIVVSRRKGGWQDEDDLEDLLDERIA
ncbi:MAG: hypothetical protein M1826_001150 [Phylliscum demangeonii]|nr:MAG: hypothetical protein M1826_001150 [Phylliscum demangeonii]